MIRNLPRDVEYQEFESSICHQSIINIVLETCISIWLTSSWQLFNYGRINMTTFACQTWVVDRHQGHSRLLAISWARAHVWPLAINKAKNSRLDCSTNLRSVYVRASGRGIAAHFSFGYFKSNQVIFRCFLQEMARKMSGPKWVTRLQRSHRDSSNIPDDFIQNTKLTTMKLRKHVFKITLFLTIKTLWDVMTSQTIY